MTDDRNLMSDRELDQLLAHASAPPLPDAARGRLLQRLAEEEAKRPSSNVVSLTEARARRAAQQAPSSGRLGWLAGLPLAASLALGIYLGAGGTFDGYLTTSAYDLIAGNTSDTTLTGIEDMESYTEESRS
ncbi:hypothetical protein [Aestuariivirga sp.]|uniref:hypothetical protein n=1 Tax=Aestuariivirga sp. TaxID=2650926 RepID=UPI0039E597D3